MSYFAFIYDDVMTSPKMNELFDGPPRAAESEITQREMDIAASIQVVTEEIVMRTARTAHELTGSKNLTLAGGVALNCVANGKILREGPFENVWIQPAAGDAGGALGAAMFVWHQLLDNPRTTGEFDSQFGSFLGEQESAESIAKYLDSVGAIYQKFSEEEKLCDRVAELLADENVIGHVGGRMEFGPRALGARSILGDARSPRMQEVMNVKIKFRESFRPFAPAVLKDRVDEYFEMRPEEESPYMLLVAPVKKDKLLNAESSGEKGLDQLKQLRSVVPAITHVDNSARVQTIDEARNPRFHGILKKFEERTGSPVLINTSFNVRGEPIVRTSEDAYRCFMHTNMDVLVLEDFVLLKDDQPDAREIDLEAYLTEFALD
jgi:carbamoyltransferase